MPRSLQLKYEKHPDRKKTPVL